MPRSQFRSGLNLKRSRKTVLKKYVWLMVPILFYTSYYIGIIRQKEQSADLDGGKGLSNEKATAVSFASNTNDCKIYYGKYNGKTYTLPTTTVGNPRCLIESKWMKVMEHSVNLGGDSVIDDWLWIDYHDRINVLVQDPKDSKSFLIFRQTKYALEGKDSLAIIGGIIEPGETAEIAAKREVNEEFNGMACSKYISLGRFRTDVNRGLGWVNSFVAIDCHHDESNKFKQGTNSGEKHSEEVGAADTERQDIISMKLSQVRQSVMNGEFMEVQWSNTVSLAMLHPEVVIFE